MNEQLHQIVIIIGIIIGLDSLKMSLWCVMSTN